MKKKSTTFGASSEKLAQLLSMARPDQTDSVECTEADAKAELLHDILAKPMPLMNIAGGQTACIGHTLKILSGVPLGELLLDPEVDMAMLRRIKDCGRRLSTSGHSKVEQHVGNTVYYAAIANALSFHHRKITTHSDRDLLEYFRRLKREKWIPEGIVKLFATALIEYKQYLRDRHQRDTL